MDDDAASPVLGVILMVAITVVLGSVVFLLTKEFQQENEAQQVHFAGRTDEARDQWELQRGPQAGVVRADIEWRGDPGVRYAIDAPATAASPLVPTEWTPLGGQESWDGGSVIWFCGDGLPVLDWDFQFRETQTGALRTAGHFVALAPCV